jgi:hypothetical protein
MAIGYNINQPVGFNVSQPVNPNARQLGSPYWTAAMRGLGSDYVPPGQPNPAAGGNGSPQNVQGYGQSGAFPQFFQNYMNQMQNSYNEAKQANLDRYNQGLAGWSSLQNQASGLVDKFGTSQRAEINRRFDAQKGSTDQGLVNSGLSNSTIQGTMNAGLERQRGYALNDLGEQVARQKLGVLGQFGEGRLGYMERRNDPYPDMNSAMQMAMQYAALQNVPRGSAGGGGQASPAWGMMPWGGGGGAPQGFANPFMQPMQFGFGGKGAWGQFGNGKFGAGQWGGADVANPGNLGPVPGDFQQIEQPMAPAVPGGVDFGFNPQMIA